MAWSAFALCVADHEEEVTSEVEAHHDLHVRTGNTLKTALVEVAQEVLRSLPQVDRNVFRAHLGMDCLADLCRTCSRGANENVEPALTDRVPNSFVVIISDVLEGDEQQVADELADVACVHRLSGDDLCDAQDLGVGDLLDFF